ncbi:MAG: redoxin domain-containing protein [Chitinophagaceae bacterium]|nr:redoxin domain-containing protein [Chitinophagaceae bacterium]
MMFFSHAAFCFAGPDEPVSLSIGAAAPPFSLKGTDNKTYTLASFKKYKILVIVFTCNHCPTAQAYEERIIQLAKDYKDKNVAVVAVSPNDPSAVRLDELGYADMGDSFEEMKLRAKQKKFNFPYLYDGATQTMSKAYGPVTTPHVFIFDKERKLRYQGRIDDVEKPGKTPNHYDTRNALEELLLDKEITVPVTKVFGCSVKWAGKKDWVKKGFVDWAKEPVSLELINEQGIKDLLKNNTDKLRLINVWATWCGPCMIEFPEFVTINRMYRGRDFEFISICLDDTSKKAKALKFLEQKQASNKNYLFDIGNKYALIETVDPKWQGALPYTLLVEPGGKIAYAKQYIIDPAKMKQLIVDHPLIGRYY